MLEGLFASPMIAAVAEVLGPDKAGKLAVVGDAKLAAALAANREVTAVGLAERATKKLSPAIACSPELPGDRSLGAVIGVDVTTDEGWPATLRSWTEAVHSGGTIVMVDRGRPAEASRRALCAGLTAIAQRRVGRAVVTSGIVTHLK